ncbi:MAG: hypothetical protein CENE_02087 [Candidatus Celerinatantimonas neptuna]|nr:MAG: hypothetical protein CENE_02087 [Candidatus Celerinatantimonas neptuna]
MDSLKIAAVIVTYNRSEMLKSNLLSLESQGVLDIFIIDNDSSDDTQKVVSDFSNNSKNKVFYKNSGGNLGGAGGFNLGCQIALDSGNGYTHLWLADDDVTFHKDCLKQLKVFIDDKTILQPMRFDKLGNNVEASAINIDLSSIFILNHKRNSVLKTCYAYYNTPFDIQNIPFEGPLIPTQIFYKIGLPDHRYFIFSDDLDFSLKSLNNGFSIKCIPLAKMTRLKPVEPNYQLKDWKSYFVYRNFFHIQKTFGTNTWVRHRPYLMASMISLYCILSLNFKGLGILKDALLDGMSTEFRLNNKYIP